MFVWAAVTSLKFGCVAARQRFSCRGGASCQDGLGMNMFAFRNSPRHGQMEGSDGAHAPKTSGAGALVMPVLKAISTKLQSKLARMCWW